ncbi:unknown [Euproctis pseudoconspersa nucleopolyhedrovirus]|uniref:Uncharacterized protein n=1 Tax=Euproctis pseudoconspersa nucleopolyhedrovirus TaxID=307467 RepID=C3TWW6_9ABAC|nr:hypothetical protein EupsNPV_gp058 [Euproctis pseudoconspersa nucleopolyhedrovirus]ACO53508.1 unknown [Euproctis pseudoconspersa nucleopolyhedrovirus]
MPVDSLQTWSGRAVIRCAVPAIELCVPRFDLMSDAYDDDGDFSWLSGRPKLATALKSLMRILPLRLIRNLVSNCIHKETIRLIADENERLLMIRNHADRFYVFEFMNSFCNDVTIDDIFDRRSWRNRRYNFSDEEFQEYKRDALLELQKIEKCLLTLVNNDPKMLQTYVWLCEKIKMLKLVHASTQVSFFSNFEIYKPTFYTSQYRLLNIMEVEGEGLIYYSMFEDLKLEMINLLREQHDRMIYYWFDFQLTEIISKKMFNNKNVVNYALLMCKDDINYDADYFWVDDMYRNYVKIVAKKAYHSVNYKRIVLNMFVYNLLNDVAKTQTCVPFENRFDDNFIKNVFEYTVEGSHCARKRKLTN